MKTLDWIWVVFILALIAFSIMGFGMWLEDTRHPPQVVRPFSVVDTTTGHVVTGTGRNVKITHKSAGMIAIVEVEK